MYPILYILRTGRVRVSPSHSIRYYLLRAINSNLTEDIDMAKIAANPEKHIFDGALKVKRVSSV